jgi:predicted ester cyclase
MSTTNTDMARRLIAAYDASDESVIDELIHPQHRDHAPDEEGLGRDAVRDSMRWVKATFGDRETEIEDLFATDDRVVARVRFAATQIGELPMGLPPTGRRFETEHVHIWRVADGQLAEHWMLRDDLGAVRQLQA